MFGTLVYRQAVLAKLLFICVEMIGATAAVSLADEVHDGKVVSAADGKLTILDKEGDAETFAVPASCKITLDGKPAQLEDLRTNFTVKVQAVRKGNSLSATSIEASTVE